MKRLNRGGAFSLVELLVTMASVGDPKHEDLRWLTGTGSDASALKY